jgi:hypothetical protein
MACNYSNLCDAGFKIASGVNAYVNNGEGVHAPFIFKNNHVYMPYVELAIGEDLYVTGDAEATATINYPICDINELQLDRDYNVATTKSYIQSFEMTVGKSFEGSIVIVTCDYSKVNKLLNLTPPETCEWDKYDLGDGFAAFGENPRPAALIGYINIGWIIKGCNGTITKYTMKEMNEVVSNNYKTEDGREQNSGPYIYGIFKKVDVAAENGVYKVTLTFVDGFSFNEESKLDKMWGSEKFKMSFKDAIILASKFNCNTGKPDSLQKLARISFRKNAPWYFDVKEGGEAGPKSVWNSWRQGLFPFFREISLYLLTSAKKGWWFAYDNGSCSEPTILMIEDRNPSLCLNEKDLVLENGSIITYIVNGGDCSPVIKFNPSFNAVPIQNSAKTDGKGNVVQAPKENIAMGGGGPSGIDQEPIQLLDCATKFDDKGKIIITRTNRNNNNSANGTLGTVSSSAEAMNFRSPKNITKDGAEATYNQAKAEAGDGNAMNLFAPIKATLEIHGDPFWANSINLFKNFFIKIIFINSYCIEKSTKIDGACEFLQKPKCNSRFSGIYKVGSAKHSISSGSYVTSLELFSISSDDQMVGMPSS